MNQPTNANANIATTLTPGCLHAGGRRETSIILDAAGVLHTFTGADIPGVAVVTATDYNKNGKWSYTTYHVTLAPGAMSTTLLADMHAGGVFVRCGSWAEAHDLVSRRLGGKPITNFEEWLRGSFGAAAKRLDKVAASVEAMLDAAEASDPEFEGEMVELEARFGSPTNRQVAAGYWNDAHALLLPDGSPSGAGVAKINPEGGWVSGNLRIVDMEIPEQMLAGVIQTVVHLPGRHGGTIIITAAMPAG